MNEEDSRQAIHQSLLASESGMSLLTLALCARLSWLPVSF